MHRVFLGLGGNIGDLPANFRKAKGLIGIRIGKITRASSIYKTPPLGFESPDFFWNQVAEVKSSLEAEAILGQIHKIEKEMGRVRIKGQYTSRPMDIDILYFDNEVIETTDLKIPHPLIQERKFVLVPLAEIAPGWIHPLLNKNSLELLKECPDNSPIEKLF